MAVRLLGFFESRWGTILLLTSIAIVLCTVCIVLAKTLSRRSTAARGTKRSTTAYGANVVPITQNLGESNEPLPSGTIDTKKREREDERVALLRTMKQSGGSFDRLVHHSSEKLPLPFFSRETQRYSPDFVTGNQLATFQKRSETFAKFDLPNENDGYDVVAWSNYRAHVCSNMYEVWCKGNGLNYMSANREKFRSLGSVERFAFAHGDYMLIAKLRRLIDGKEFRQVMYTQNWAGFKNPNSYRALHAACRFLIERYPREEFIISGDFNVQGHAKVFERFFPDYLICDFARMPTCLDNEGIASPDGVVVSPRLYSRLEYRTEFCSSESYQHMVLVIDMLTKEQCEATGKPSGAYVSERWTGELFTRLVLRDAKGRDNFYGDEGNYDSMEHNERYDSAAISLPIASNGKILRCE